MNCGSSGSLIRRERRSIVGLGIMRRFDVIVADNDVRNGHTRVVTRNGVMLQGVHVVLGGPIGGTCKIVECCLSVVTAQATWLNGRSWEARNDGWVRPLESAIMRTS
jgi:hypothetical protein